MEVEINQKYLIIKRLEKQLADILLSISKDREIHHTEPINNNKIESLKMTLNESNYIYSKPESLAQSFHFQQINQTISPQERDYVGFTGDINKFRTNEENSPIDTGIPNELASIKDENKDEIPLNILKAISFSELCKRWKKVSSGDDSKIDLLYMVLNFLIVYRILL